MWFFFRFYELGLVQLETKFISNWSMLGIVEDEAYRMGLWVYGLFMVKFWKSPAINRWISVVVQGCNASSWYQLLHSLFASRIRMRLPLQRTMHSKIHCDVETVNASQRIKNDKLFYNTNRDARIYLWRWFCRAPRALESERDAFVVLHLNIMLPACFACICLPFIITCI